MSKPKWHSRVIHLIVALLIVALTLMLSSSPVPVLAAPVVVSVPDTPFGADTTDHNVDMPATVDAGDLLIVLFTNDGDATVTTPAGWSLLASDINGVHVRVSVYYKIAVGTEGGTTVNFVTSAAEEAAAQVYMITNWHGTTPPEISTAVTGSGKTPDPASLDPVGWDVADTLWLAVAGQDKGDEQPPTYPASYTDGISTLSSTGNEGCQTHSARRVLTAASEDPGAFTIPANNKWVAFTIAVRPAPRDLTISSTVGGSVTTPGEDTFPYDDGTVVDLIAQADACYEFVNWTGDTGTIADVNSPTTTITMNDNYSITANFDKISYNLTTGSTTGGSVTTPGEGTFPYDCGSVVDLIAQADACYEFVNWSGDTGTIADVNDATTNITMNDNYSITANFDKISYNLTTDSTAGGSVTTPGEGTYPYDCGTVVDLVAEADSCYEFVNWTGDVGTIADVNDATTTITMNGNYSITANFDKISYDLTTGSTAGGSVTTPGEGTYPYDCGSVVDLIAQADACYEFVNWSGDTGTIADVNDATTTITMNDNYSITANFAPLSYNLTTDSSTGGSVTTPGEGTFPYDCGTVVDLIAQADACYEFVNWTGDVGTVDDVNSPSTTITMNDDYSITANFDKISYNLTTDSTAGGSVTTPGEGTFPYDCGTVVDLVAQADACYEFVEWSGDVGTIADVNAASTNVTMSGDYSITANFAPLSYNLTTGSTVGGSVTTPGEGTFPYDCGSVVDLIAQADACYEFVEWTGDVGTVDDVNSP
jgi:preprotein translocase subunit YajC